ncbi:hypothetical protein [Polaribacter sp. R77954]|uniref:hypothetical protein n=1 Tax=Polaribacter sp. R77954 TaxID=3093870 RepID=UPI0037C8E968
MKKLIQLFTICLVITACDFQKVTDLQDNFEIKVSAEPVFSIVNLKVFNAKDGSDILESLDLSFSGADADKIYTVNGTRDYKIENGFVTLGINRNSTVSAENPISVTAVISASGYVSKTQEVNFDGSDIQEVQISLMKESDLPQAVSFQSVTEGLTDNKTTQEILLEVPPANDEDDVVEVSIPADTEFYDEDGNTITGSDVTVELQSFDTTVPTLDELSENVTNPETLAGGFNEFPGSLEIDAPAKSSNSTNAIGSYLSPIGSLYCIYYYVNGRRVSGVSRPTTYSFSVNSNTINPNTGQRAKAGDIISFYRTVNNTNTKIADIPLTSRTSWWGRTYLSFRVTIPAGPGVYPYGFEVTPSCNTLSSNGGVTFKNDGRRTFYSYYVASKYNPRRALRWGYMYFDGTYQVNQSNLRYYRNRALDMLKDDMILTIYYYNRQDRRYTIAYQEEVSKCDLDGQTIDITNTECYQERDLDLSLECPDATYLLNNLYVYYKKESDRSWSYFDRVSNSRLNGKSPCLEAGVKYQFGFWYGGWKVTPPLTEQEMLNLYLNFDLPTICNAIRDL